MSRIASLWNLSPLKIVVPKKFVSLPDISALNFMVGWCLFASKKNWSISSLSVSYREKTSSMYLFHSRGLILLLLIISVSTADRNMFAKETVGSISAALSCLVLPSSRRTAGRVSSKACLWHKIIIKILATLLVVRNVIWWQSLAGPHYCLRLVTFVHVPFSPPPLLILAFQTILFHTIVTDEHYMLFSIEQFF